MSGQPLGDPFFDTAVGLLDRPTPCGGANDRLIGCSGTWRTKARIEQLAIGAVAEDQSVLSIIEDEPFRYRFDRVGQSTLDPLERDLGVSLRVISLQDPTTSTGWPSLSRIKCHSSCTQQ
jgi:hypothetical protein